MVRVGVSSGTVSTVVERYSRAEGQQRDEGWAGAEEEEHLLDVRTHGGRAVDLRVPKQLRPHRQR